MHRRIVAQSFTFRVTIALTICVSLLLLPNTSFLFSVGAESQGQGTQRRVRPGPRKPEGELPDFEEVQNESQLEREAPPPIPSTIRSQRNPLKPWDGRRVAVFGLRANVQVKKFCTAFGDRRRAQRGVPTGERRVGQPDGYDISGYL